MSTPSPTSPTTPALITPINAHFSTSFPPVITITQATLPSSPYSPLSPSPILTSAKPIPVPPTPASYPIDSAYSLYDPLRRHLALLHPTTPTQIVGFIANRLLSRDTPYGHGGPWTPLWALEGCVDLSTAGLGVEAGRGCRQREGGRGKEVDRVVEEMYSVARRSWGLLEEKAPGVAKL